jgi:hypothetical protein
VPVGDVVIQFVDVVANIIAFKFVDVYDSYAQWFVNLNQRADQVKSIWEAECYGQRQDVQNRPVLSTGQFYISERQMKLFKLNNKLHASYHFQQKY